MPEASSPKLRRALLSVSDKRGLLELARGLVAQGFELVSTGGTFRGLGEAGVPVTAVAEVTGFPEILDGRVKTLHPAVHGGILADRSVPGHREQLAAHAITAIDLVVVNLYPFRETVASPETSEAEGVEMIDIGGPTMIRAAAKNFAHVTVVVDPDDYPAVLTALAEGGGEASLPLRRDLAAKAFRHTADYDAAIAAWFATRLGDGAPPETALPRQMRLDLLRVFEPRYGENPHQPAGVYRRADGAGIFGGLEQLQGKELSYNNLLDADAARKMAALFTEPAVVIVKHNNPSGVGRHGELTLAYRLAHDCDPVSAFGSVIAVNRPITRALAAAMADLFIEVLVAPGFEPGAREIFAAKTQLRLLDCPLYLPQPGDIELRSIDGGLLAQTPDAEAENAAEWTCPTRRGPTSDERRSLEMAWNVARYTKSNAIVLADASATVGIGAGQMSRVDSCRLAIEKARRTTAGTAAASDAFFPFRDGLDLLAEAGVTAVIQPGGSKRDAEIIAAADEHGMAMLLTGRRHFRH